MKINYADDEYTVYLNKLYNEKINFFIVEELEECMNNLFNIIKKTYDIELNGYYNVNVYIDNNYGVIINIKKEEIDYYDYFGDQIDTQITIHKDSEFMYKINDFMEVKKYLEKNYNLYKYENELYIKLNNLIDNNKLGIILEYCDEICYDIDEIKKSINLIFCNK